MTFLEINNELIRIGETIESLSQSLTDAREAYLTAKALYENDFARYCLEVKARHPKKTQTDVKAEATNLAHSVRMEYIKADSKYRRVQNEIKAKQDRMEALREVSFNLRREAEFLKHTT